MIVTFVHIWVKEVFLENFKRATIENQEKSLKEPGNLRFDFLQDSSDPLKFVLYEAYDSEESAAAHKLTPHYQKWRDTVAEMMAKPREGIKHNIISPVDKSLW